MGRQQHKSAGLNTRPYSGLCFGPADGGQGGAQSHPSHSEASGTSTFGRLALAACGAKIEAAIWPQFWPRDMAPLVGFSANSVSTLGAAWVRNFAGTGAPFWRVRVSPCGAPALPGQLELALLCRWVFAIDRRRDGATTLALGLPQAALALQPPLALQHVSVNDLLPNTHASPQSSTSQAARRERTVALRRPALA